MQLVSNLSLECDDDYDDDDDRKGAGGRVRRGAGYYILRTHI